MPPKKRDKDSENQKSVRMEGFGADNQLFLQAFEKPTRIYRFLRTRNQMSPLFLQRNLTFMRHRLSRTHTIKYQTSKMKSNGNEDKLRDEKISRLQKLNDKLMVKKEQERVASSCRHMSITFLGFYDKKINSVQDTVKVETNLLKISHKKRKDVSSPMTQVCVGTCEVPMNPPENQPLPKVHTVSIPNETFNISNGHTAKTYMLLLKVHYFHGNGFTAQNGEVDEPAQKRRKITNGTSVKMSEEVKLYGCELVVYDKHNHCKLVDGDYEFALQEDFNLRPSPKKHSSWETVSEFKDIGGPFESFEKGPSLKVKLCWTTEATNGFIDIPSQVTPLANVDNKENQPGNNGINGCSTNHNNNSTTNNNNNTNLSTSLVKTENSETPIEIVYQFLYNNNSRQQTEPNASLHCPWCSLDCGRLYSLLKHLKLCHSRFTFTYVPIPDGARVDVAINEVYDGSYSGSPHELIVQPANAAAKKEGPTRRTSVTNILVCRPKRPAPSLSEFLELDENELESQRPYIIGHNRLYHHTVTCLPIYPKELDAECEGEYESKWLQTKTTMMIDDFTDVNEGEKELMKMWNLHVMKHNYVGDCNIPLACFMFLESKGRDLLMKNLYRNFILHLSNLFDFGLISPVVFFQVIQRLQSIMKAEDNNGYIRKILQKSHADQVTHCMVTGSDDKSTISKSNLTFENTNYNARRKTNLPMGSPPNVNLKNSTHNNSLFGKHQNIMGNQPNSPTSSKNLSTIITNTSNGINQSNETQQKQSNVDVPLRRKSTNSVLTASSSNNDSSNNSVPRRKSMASDINASSEYKRKLILDSLPNLSNANNNSNNQKTAQNGGFY